MKYLILFSISALGCASDPCDGKGPCLAVHVAGSGSVTSIDQLALKLSGAVTLDARTPSTPGSPTALPVAVAVTLPAGRSGPLDVVAQGFLGGTPIGAARTSTTLTAGANSVHITLAGSDPPDLGAPGDLSGADFAGPDLFHPDIAGSGPVLLDVAPRTGPTTGGTRLTLSGDRFVDGLTVTIDGKPATAVTWISATEVTAVSPADPGARGKVKVVVTNPDMQSGAGDLFGYSAGTLAFSPPGILPIGGSARSLVLAPFRGPPLDVAIASQAGANLTILFGKGDGTFLPGGTYPTGNSPHEVRAADLNGDKVLDLVVANQATNNVAVLLGVAGGTFKPAVAYPTGTNAAG
jgi:hypothetical protein